MDIGDPEKMHLPSDADRLRLQQSSVAIEDCEIKQNTGPHGDQHSEDFEHRLPSDSIEPAPAEVTQLSARSKSRTSSTRSRPLSIVPRSKRRGLLGRFALIPEVERPHDYGNSTKWAITAIVALAAAAAPIGSAIFYPALPQLSEELYASPTITNLSVAMYMLSMSIFPLWWSSFSETLGRRTIYLISFALFVLWSVVSAVSTSIGMLIVMRILGGGAAASVQAVGAGTIADIWESGERGRAMGIFYLGPLMGPLLAPIIGGLLSEHLGWRSTMWFLAIYGGILWLVLCFCLPETLKSKNSIVEDNTLPSHNNGKDSKRPPLTRVSTRQSVQQKARTVASVFKRFFIDPLSVLAYLRFPAVAITVYYASITFGSLYVLNISVQQTFSTAPYNYSSTIIGLLYVPVSLGYIAASVVGGRWSDKIMHREARRANRYGPNGKLILIPEDRMRENAYLAAAVYPAALVWYGWAVKYHVHWIVPALANFFFGLGSMVIFTVSTTMLTEFMPKRSSSGVAVNNFVRNIFGCVGGIVASPLIDTIGNGWLFTGLGVIAWCSVTVVWALRRYGPRWREQMDRALNGW